MNRKVVIGAVIGLVIGMVSGFFVGVFFNSSSNLVSSAKANTGVGTDNQVRVSGSIKLHSIKTKNVIYFSDLNGTFETSCAVTNGHYSALLLGGESYLVYDFSPTSKDIDSSSTDYNPFYVPAGISTFTENLAPSF